MKKYEDFNYIESVRKRDDFIFINYELLEINNESKAKTKKSLEEILNKYLNNILEIINSKKINVEEIDVEEYLLDFKFDPKLNLTGHEINVILGEEDYIVSEIITKLSRTNKRTFTLPLRLKNYEEYMVPAIINGNNINYLTLYIIIHFALIYSKCKEYIN